MSIDNPYEPPEASLVLPNYKLDPKKIIAGALVFVFEKKLILGKALAIPFVLYLIIDLASGWNVSAIGTLLLAIGNLVVPKLHKSAFWAVATIFCDSGTAQSEAKNEVRKKQCPEPSQYLPNLR